MLTPTRLNRCFGPFFEVINRGEDLCRAIYRGSIILFCTLFYTSLVLAADATLVRVNMTPKNPWVGQKVVVHLDVLGADGWAQLKKAGDVEIKGGYLLRLESQGTRLNETIEGVKYTGQRYEFLFFAQRDGKISIPEMAVDVEVKSWGGGSKSETKRLMTPSIHLLVKQPPGTAGLTGLVSTTDFSATQEWTPGQESFAVGDAVVRKVSLKATDVTGMAFTPIIQTDMDNISTYLSEPGVEDSFNRGVLVGKRYEKLTYVFEKQGKYPLPDLSYSWWNTTNEKLETVTLPGLLIQVTGAAVEQASTTAMDKNKIPIRSLLWCICVIVIFSAVVFRYKTTIRDYFHRLHKAYRESERKYFSRVKVAAQHGDTQKMLKFTMQWLDSISTDNTPARLDLFLASHSDSAGQQTYIDFNSQDKKETEKERVKKLLTVLTRARAAWLRKKKKKQKTDILLPEVGLSGEE